MKRLITRFKRTTDAIGARGERTAARWLRKRGYRILARNLKLGDDEADLIAETPDQTTIVVVEVKTRSDDNVVPEAHVGHVKQARLTRLAARLQRQRRFAGRPLRFDVVAVILPPDGEPTVRHTESAFDSKM